MKGEGPLSKVMVMVTSGGKTCKHKLSAKPHEWQSEEMMVDIKGHEATITFRIEGKAKAECRIDDVELTKY